MRHVLMLSFVPVALALTLGCDQDPEPEAAAPTLTPVPAAVDDGAVEAPPVVNDAPDAGPGTLSEATVTAFHAMYSDARRVRCDPSDLLAGDGLLEAMWLGPGNEHLRAVTLDGTTFAAAVPVHAGAAIVTRDRKPVAKVVWPEAPKGVWSTCRVMAVQPFQILGLVQDSKGELIAGATVRGCMPGAVATSTDAGRFELQGIAGVACPVLAIVDGPEGLGRSDSIVIESNGADVITELQVADTRIDEATQDVQAQRLLGVIERQVRNGIANEVVALQGHADTARLSGGAKLVSDQWLANIKAREAREQALVDVLKKGGHDGLLGFWMLDY